MKNAGLGPAFFVGSLEPARGVFLACHALALHQGLATLREIAIGIGIGLHHIGQSRLLAELLVDEIVGAFGAGLHLCHLQPAFLDLQLPQLILETLIALLVGETLGISSLLVSAHLGGTSVGGALLLKACCLGSALVISTLLLGLGQSRFVLATRTVGFCLPYRLLLKLRLVYRVNLVLQARRLDAAAEQQTRYQELGAHRLTP